MSRMPFRRREFLQATGLGVVTVAGVGEVKGQEVTEIEDWHELNAVRENLNNEYVLVADLGEGTAGYDEYVGNQDAGWNPIGDDDNPFRGAFDGNGHKITGLQIDRPNESDIGLFGVIENGQLEDIKILQVDVTGDFSVGAIVGSNNWGIVVASEARGKVTGRANVGILIGNSRTGEMVRSKASGEVTGDRSVGVLIGGFHGSVVNSHYNLDNVVINGKQILTVGGLFDEQFQDWGENDRELNLTDYDSLEHVESRVEINDIQSAKDALGFMQDSGYDWKLTSDIDFTGDDTDLYFPYLAGDLDGNGYTVTLSIDHSVISNLGLIGYNNGGQISDISVEGMISGYRNIGGIVGENDGTVRQGLSRTEVTGFSEVGGLVGRNLGEIIESEAEGEVAGDIHVGGLVGDQQPDREIIKSSASGDVNGSLRQDGRSTGGLVGFDWGGNIRKSKASGQVSGSERVGGLVGETQGQISESSATGNVNGNERVGSLAGYIWQGEINESWASGEVNGENDIGGIIGQLGSEFSREDSETLLRDSYWDETTTGVDEAVSTIQTGEGITEIRGEVEGLTTEQMTGEAARESMGALNFDETWQVVTDPDDYPHLAWRTEDDQDDDTGTETSTDDETDEYDSTTNQDEVVDDEVPGFGVVQTLTAVCGIGYLIKKRLSTDD